MNMKNVRKAFTSSVDIETAKDFNNIALSLEKKPAALIREFIIAAVENRVKITPAKNTNGEFYKNIYG